MPWSESAETNASTIGLIATSRYFAPMRRARSSASERECSEEYALGSAIPCTLAPPIASAAIAATTAESIPPDTPSTTERNPFLTT